MKFYLVYNVLKGGKDCTEGFVIENGKIKEPYKKMQEDYLLFAIFRETRLVTSILETKPIKFFTI